MVSKPGSKTVETSREIEGGSEITQTSKVVEKKSKSQRSQLRETMGGFETRPAKVELAIANGQEKFEEVEEGMDGLREEI